MGLLDKVDNLDEAQPAKAKPKADTKTSKPKTNGVNVEESLQKLLGWLLKKS